MQKEHCPRHIQKLFKNSIVYGTYTNYKKVEFRMTFEDMINEKGNEARKFIEGVYFSIKNKLRKDERILNEKYIRENL